MLNTVMGAGDSFTYTLSATGGNVWTLNGNNFLFPFLALVVNNDDNNRFQDFTVDLKLGGSTVFTYSESNIGTCCIHLGSNLVTPNVGLVWDQWVLNDTILSSGTPITPQSLLPYNGNGPENYFDGQLSYGGGAIPEPTTWALLIGGFGLAGTALRRQRRRVAVTA